MGTHPIFESDFDCLTEMEHTLNTGKFVVGSTAFNATCGSLTGVIILFLICALVWLQKEQQKQARLSKQRKSASSQMGMYNVVRRLSIKEQRRASIEIII